MVNGIGTIYPSGLNKGFGSRFCVGTRVRHETPEEVRRTYEPKRCEYNNDDEDNSPNILRENGLVINRVLVREGSYTWADWAEKI